MKSNLCYQIIVILMLVFSGNALADTCFDPYYGYYQCDRTYYNYPDQGQAIMEGFILGAIVGGFVNDSDDNRHNNWNGHGNWNHGNWGHENGSRYQRGNYHH